MLCYRLHALLMGAGTPSARGEHHRAQCMAVSLRSETARHSRVSVLAQERRALPVGFSTEFIGKVADKSYNSLSLHSALSSPLSYGHPARLGARS
jgi:hypothetical protein